MEAYFPYEPSCSSVGRSVLGRHGKVLPSLLLEHLHIFNYSFSISFSCRKLKLVLYICVKLRPDLIIVRLHFLAAEMHIKKASITLVQKKCVADKAGVLSILAFSLLKGQVTFLKLCLSVVCLAGTDHS